MAELPVGCGPITWRPYQRQDEAAWPEERILAEIAEAGYDGAPASVHPTRSTEETLALYRELGLRVAPGYLGAPLWQADQRESIVERAKRDSALMRAGGCDALYVAAGGAEYTAASGKTRRQVSGQVTAEDGLTDEEMKAFAGTLNEVGAATLAEGVRSCFHNHVGTVIETRAEFERLLALADPATVFLGPDTGHIAWAGDDPVAFCRDYAARIKTIHVKDIDQAVAARGRAEGWDYGGFSANGIWLEPGSGAIDFPAILADLEAAGLDGWIIVETDVTPLSSALESATVSRNYLRTIGL